MENQSKELRSIENLSNDEKLELFKVEELETRLEMAAADDGGLIDVKVDANGLCW